MWVIAVFRHITLSLSFMSFIVMMNKIVMMMVTMIMVVVVGPVY